MKRHLFHYDEVVIGSNLASILYAYVHELPLIFKEVNPPKSYDYLDKDFPLDNLYIVNEQTEIKTPSGIITKGMAKEVIYGRLIYALSLSGLVPASDKVSKIRILDDKKVKVATERARMFQFTYNTLRVFSPELISGIRLKEKKKGNNIIYDHFKCNIKPHDYDWIMNNERFIEKIVFLSEKELVAVSKLTLKELHDFDFSVIPLRYKIQGILKKNKLLRRKTKNEIILDFIKRDVYNIDHNEYTAPEGVIIDTRTEKEICQLHQKQTSTLLAAYPWRLIHQFSDSNGMIR